MAKTQKGRKKTASRWFQSETQQLAKNLSYIESNAEKAISELAKIPNPGVSMKLGITGPPGAGKSSLVNLLIRHFRGQGLTVAVLAIDPSSPFTGGAVLGDRVRMTDHASDGGVFIRSLGTRGALGGLSAAACVMVRALEIWGFDVILIETVGVGQTELEIMNLADATAVVLVPESGDVIQTLKAGILEIADLFVVNKCDRSGAEQLAAELNALVETEGTHARPVLMTSATEDKGIGELADLLKRMAGAIDSKRKASRARGQLRSLLISRYNRKVESAIKGLSTQDPFLQFSRLSKKFK
ncbi:MAG: methylmalonyl Co-A mutase-associated GTPase MeaB [Oligoflexia bacterium]|nr:methylmalonyl Co-A mutase-associated GTPase MeaB [Oligoflexia bacterium]